MFQICTLDGWSVVGRSMFESDDLDPSVSLFFLSFIIITTWTLLPVCARPASAALTLPSAAFPDSPTFSLPLPPSAEC